jgi:DNA-binding response OmpR family regulator
MLTARASEFDRVLGLEVGADDYMTKPFSILELVARVKVQLRRLDNDPARVNRAPATLRRGEMVIDPARRIVSIGAREIDLTAKEFDLLEHMARDPGRVYTRAQLLGAVWGYSHSGYEHTVNAHINRLRNKIELDPGNPQYVRTVWGVGYKFAELAESASVPRAALS